MGFDGVDKTDRFIIAARRRALAMGRWYRYYQEPTTELGRRVQFGVLVVVLIAMGFFTWGATWICLAVLGILWAKNQPAFARLQVAARHTNLP